MESPIVVLPRFSSRIGHWVANIARKNHFFSVMNSKTTTSFPGSNIVVQMVPAGENEHVAHDWATNRFPNNFSFGSNLSKYSET